ncbi:hypothetical protein C0Q70_21725 [Pomacea canaliculata]|uniref:Uncharacterized protein n=1 Tax=Pomacea canaliculata TaxID=400727 RepID=A0A2T7NDC0_POMCA|nr:hypothetical protein C0Q70_21725 [Pomacea canaliculata]
MRMRSEQDGVEIRDNYETQDCDITVHDRCQDVDCRRLIATETVAAAPAVSWSRQVDVFVTMGALLYTSRGHERISSATLK